MAACSRYFFVGFIDGRICQYDNITSFGNRVRTFDVHETRIRSLHIMSTQLLSISRKKMCIFSLVTGRLEMKFESNLQFENAIPLSASHAWIIEKCLTPQNNYPLCTLWDISQQIPLRTLQTPPITYPTKNMIMCKTDLLMAFRKNIIMWSQDDTHQDYDVDVEGSISCVLKMKNCIRGGTTNGELFCVKYDTYNVQSHTIETWNTPFNDRITAIAHVPDTEHILVGTDVGHIILWDTTDDGTFISRRLTSRPIEHILCKNIFAMVTYGNTLECLTVIPERAVLTCCALTCIMSWSFFWRRRMIQNVKTTVMPSAILCMRKESTERLALTIMEKCTEEYNDRSSWCTERVFDSLIRATSPDAQTMLERLVTFRGPRLFCMICNDDDKDKTISFIKSCNHRFHTCCIQELIDKQPEYHEEMQYEYALSFELKCPTCRQPFTPEDVCSDTFLNENL